MTAFCPTVAIDVSRSAFAVHQPIAATLHDGFWHLRQRRNRSTGLFHGYRMLAEFGNFHNFAVAAGRVQGNFRGPQFMDSDLYKWLEAVAYELGNQPDADLSRMADEAIDLIAAAQMDDGYLNTHYQVARPGQRWTDLVMGHEMYCAGHLMQAAVAHHRATGQTKLLTVAERFAQHIAGLFGPGKRQLPCGHPEIEMALVELHRETGRPDYLSLAQFLVDIRGRRSLPPDCWLYGGFNYLQDYTPVREAQTVVGHAVRQLYLCAGVTDLFLQTGEPALLTSQERLWQDLMQGKMYITGGVGSRPGTEAFGDAFELPNPTAYCEICAAIASIFWNHRLFLATGRAAYADIIETTLYNAFLAGMSIDQERYFYHNPLSSGGGLERPGWHGCACCPPNVMRFLASLQSYVATTLGSDIYINQYISTELMHGSTRLRLRSALPWNGDAILDVIETRGEEFSLYFRVPPWCRQAGLSINGQTAPAESQKGYLQITRRWAAGDHVQLDLPMQPLLMQCDPRVENNRNCAAIVRGPLVYCLEQADLTPGETLATVDLDPHAPLETEHKSDLLGGVSVVTCGIRQTAPTPWSGTAYTPLEPMPPSTPGRMQAIPYYAWANRGPGEMRVWIPLAHRSVR